MYKHHLSQKAFLLSLQFSWSHWHTYIQKIYTCVIIHSADTIVCVSFSHKFMCVYVCIIRRHVKSFRITPQFMFIHTYILCVRRVFVWAFVNNAIAYLNTYIHSLFSFLNLRIHRHTYIHTNVYMQMYVNLLKTCMVLTQWNL